MVPNPHFTSLVCPLQACPRGHENQASWTVASCALQHSPLSLSPGAHSPPPPTPSASNSSSAESRSIPESSLEPDSTDSLPTSARTNDQTIHYRISIAIAVSYLTTLTLQTH